MLTAAIAWILSIALTIPFLIITAFISLWAAYEDGYKTSAFFTMLTTIVATALFGLPWGTVAICYIPIGLAWSFWRWRVFTIETADSISSGKITNKHSSWVEFDTEPTTLAEKEKALDSMLDLQENTPRIISWVLSWPASILERVAHDVIHILKEVITNWFAGLYNGFSNSAKKRLK